MSTVTLAPTIINTVPRLSFITVVHFQYTTLILPFTFQCFIFRNTISSKSVGSDKLRNVVMQFVHCVLFNVQDFLINVQRSMQLCSFSGLRRFQLMKLHYSFHDSTCRKWTMNVHPELCSMFTHLLRDCDSEELWALCYATHAIFSKNYCIQFHT